MCQKYLRNNDFLLEAIVIYDLANHHSLKLKVFQQNNNKLILASGNYLRYL